MGCLTVTATRQGDGLKVTTERIGIGLLPRCSLVCTANRLKYLKVSPKRIYLLKSNDFSSTVMVTSNVDWKVE